MAIVYIATNKVNGKKYVGQTKRSLRERQNQHLAAMRSNDGRKCYAFQHALQKYGPDNFIWEVVFASDDLQRINEVEVQLIALHNTTREGYNETFGGEGKAQSDGVEVTCVGCGQLFKVARNHYNVNVARGYGFQCSRSCFSPERYASRQDPSPLLGTTIPSHKRRGSVLTFELAREIRRLVASGLSQVKVGKQFGISQPHVSQIISGKMWPEED